MRNITAEDRENARRLKNIWERKKRDLNLTQVKAAKQLGMSQGSLAQYLNCHIALNYKAVIDFAKLLRVEPWEIDPSLGGLRQTAVPEGENTTVPVTRTLSGKGKPTQDSVISRYPFKNGQAHAVEVDGNEYRPFARQGAVIVASRGEDPVVGDDVLVLLADDSLTLGELIDMDAGGIDIIRYSTETEDRIPNGQLKRVDPIIEVQRPQRQRKQRLHVV